MDWNDGNIVSIAKSKDDLLKIMILEVIYNIRQLINSYYFNKAQYSNANLSKLKGFLIELQISINSAKQETLEEHLKIIDDIENAKNIKTLIILFFEMDKFLNEKGLMIWANQKKIDTDDPEEYMEAQGL